MEIEEAETDLENQPEYIREEIRALLLDCPAVAIEFDVLDRVGEGTFSSVYKARSRARTSEYYALKHIYVNSAPSRIENEVAFLDELGVLLILEHFENDDIRRLLKEINTYYIRRYMRSLFEALAYIHSHNIIHRDVKPTNFLFNMDRGEGRLVDFGLAQRLVPPSPPVAGPAAPTPSPAPAAAGPALAHSQLRARMGVDEGRGNMLHPHKLKVFARSRPPAAVAAAAPDTPTKPRVLAADDRPKPKASRAGTRGFRAPEILLKQATQTTAVDIWSAGVILLSLVTERYPFFLAVDDLSALYEIRCIFGREAMQVAGLAVERRFYESEHCSAATQEPILLRPSGEVNWRAFCEALNPAARGRYPDSVYDLLGECLQLDPAKRIQAFDAFHHDFLKLSL